jgi:ketosteroid isomerase-like protein
MSQENAEIVLEAIDVMNARKVPEHLMADDAELQNVRTAVTDNLYVGPAGFARWLDDFFGVMEADARFEVEQVLAAASDSVVVMLHLTGRGAASGAPLDLRWPATIWIREGKITRAVGYPGKEEALEAAGLAE